MDSINQILAQGIQNAPSISLSPAIRGGLQNQMFVNDNAAAAMPEFLISGAGFDMITNNIAAFKDMLSITQNGLAQMREQGESIRDLIAQAREEGVTPEIMDKIQEEVNARVAQIKQIRDNTEFNGVNPFEKSFKLDIPNVLELMGAQNKEETNNEIANMLASIDVDMAIEGDGFKIGGSAKIEIGYTEEGALQINVDASMDFDLSGLVNNGVNSDEAWDLINDFLSMLGVQEGDLGNAQNFMDALFEKMFNLMTNKQDVLTDGVNLELDSSDVLKGHIAQQASITLDGMAGQAPNIAINIL